MCGIKVLTIILILLLNLFYLTNSLKLPPQQELPAFNFPENLYSTTPFTPNPTDDFCSSTCPTYEGSEPAILKYKENEINKYKLEGLTSIHLPNTLKEESTKLTYATTFDLVAENKCTFLLRINHVEVTGLDGKKYTDNSLIGSVAKFSFNNGRLEKLCLDKKESEISANFKRSIISNLQISSWANLITGPVDSSPFYETDIYGRCPVHLETTQEPNGAWIIKKSKDLNQCKYRQGFDFAVRMGSFQSDGTYQSNPFVDATLHSVLRVDKGIIKSSESNEEYHYLPFTKYGGSQTSVVVTTRIIHIGSKSGGLQGPVNTKPASLLYETVKSYRSDASVATLIKAIQEASNEKETDVVPEDVAKEFSNFVEILQEVKKNEILIVHDQVKSGASFKQKDTAMNVFWGGLLSAATPITTETAATLLMNNEMPKDKISEFLASLAFVKHPTAETLKTLSPLLDGANIQVDRYLAIGSLIRRYISDNPYTTSPELAKLQEKLAAPLKKRNVAQMVEEQDLVIASLKGLRNAQYLSPEVSSLVQGYAKNREIPNRLRIAALQTMAVNSSNEANKKVALSLFQTKEEDSEIRIAAFLLYADSPTTETALNVKNLLDEEPSDQVGSFLVSWIRNLKTTTDPKKENLKLFYGNIKSKNKYPIDFRQFSQNYHLSQLFSSLNTGYSADINLIFSPKSYVPRSTSLNLDTYIFGNSLNLFEFDARFENVEYLLEKTFGPRSYLRTNKVEDIADDVSEMTKNLAHQAAQKASLLGRGKREIKNIDETISQLKKKLSTSDKYMDMDFSMKMFESEIFWAMYHTEENDVASGEYLDNLFKRIQKAIEDAENIDINYKRYARAPIVSNNVINYPTSSGFPIKITINAHTAVNFQMKGNVDIAKILENPKSAEVHLSVIPSAVVNIEGAIEIDASVISAGLKISSTIRSATGLKLSFKMLDGNGYDLKFGLPVKEQDLLTMRTEAFTTMRERGLLPTEMSINSNGKRYKYESNFAQLSDLTGLALKTEINIPSVSYPPSLGTGVFSIRLVKVDELLQDYHMKIFYNNKEKNYRSVEFLIDTPDSQINRKISFFADVNSKEKKLTAKFITAKREMSVEAFGQAKNNEVFCLMKFKNGGSEYSAKLGATISAEKYRTTYKPYLELNSPVDPREVTLERHRSNSKGLMQPVTINGLIVLDKKKNSNTYRLYDFQKLAIKSLFGQYMINGRVMIDSEYPRYATDLTLTYGDANTIYLKSALNYTKNLPEDKQLVAGIYFMPSQWPTYGLKYTLNFNKTPTAYERTMTMITGDDLKDENMKLTTKEVLRTTNNPETDEFESLYGNYAVSYPLWKTDIDVFFKKEYHNFYSTSGTFDLDKTHIVLNGSVAVGQIKPGTVEVILASQMNEKQFHLKGIRELIDEETSKITMDVNTKPGKQLDIVMNVTHRLKPNNYALRANSVITVSPDNRIYKQDIGFECTPTQKKFHILFSPNNVRNVEVSGGYVTSPTTFDLNAVLFILNNIDGTSNLKIKSDKINGDLRMDIKKMNRQILGDLEIDVHDGTQYTGFGELQWDASKDKNKKIRIDTNTLVTENRHEIITENTIQMMDYHFQLNGNISYEGDLLNNTFQSHLQFVLSNGTTMGVNVQRQFHFLESVYNYDLNVDGYHIPQEEGQDSELTFGLKARDFDLSNYLFDLKMNWSLSLPKSKSLKNGFQVKRVVNNKLWTLGGNMYVDGTIVKKKLDLLLEAEYSDLVNDYGFLSEDRSLPASQLHVHGGVGEDYVLDSRATLHNAEISNVLEVKIPVQNKSLELKWTTKTKIEVVPAQQLILRTDNNVQWNDNKYAKWDGKLEIYPKNGLCALAWESSDIVKRSMDLFYVFDDSQKGILNGPFARVGVNLTFDGKVANCVGKLEFSKDLSTKLLTIIGQSPKNGSFEIRAETKVVDFGQNVFQDLSIVSNDKRWYASSHIITYPTKPMIDLLYSSPEAESKFKIEFEERIRNYWTGAINVSLMHGVAGYVKLDGELKLDTKDDILIKLDVDAPSFGVNNFSFVANNKAMEGGRKRVAFTTRMDKQLLFAGSTAYMYYADSNKLTFEGGGTVRIDEKNHPFTFKYYKIQLSASTVGETGSASKLYVSVDNKKYVLDMEFKFTDRSFMLKRDLWYGPECYKMDVSYQIKMTDIVNYDKILMIQLDLKPHIPQGEKFVIEGKTTRTLSNYDQKLSLQWAPGKKIEYIFYSTSGKSGFTIILPKRQLGAEAVYIHELTTTNGNLKLNGTFWFDKTKDESKMILISTGAEYKVPESQNTFVLRSATDLRIPTLSKSLSINKSLILSLHEEKSIDFTAELDLFKKREQMIVLTYQLFKGRKDGGYKIWSSLKAVSEGQKMNTELKRSITFFLDHMEYHLAHTYVNYKGVQKTAAIDFELRPTSVAGKIQYENFILQGRSEIGMGRNYLELREDFNLFGHEYKKFVRLTLDPSIIITLEWKGLVKQTAKLNTTLVWNQALDVNLDLVDNGEIATFKLFLNDERFMNSETEFFIDNARILLDNGKKDLLSLIDDSKKGTKSAMNEITTQYAYRSKQFRDANLDMKPTFESSNAYLVALKNEIKSDPSIISASQNVKKIVNGGVDFIFTILEQISSFMGDWLHGYDVLSVKLSELLEEIANITNKISQLSMDEISLYLKDSLNHVWRLTLRLIEYVKANKTKWKDAVISASDSVKDSFRVISETLEQFKNNAQEFSDRLRAYLTSLPITNYLKERFVQFKNSQVLQYMWSAVRDAGENIKEYIPNEQFKTLFTMIFSIMDKIVNEKPYNMEDEMKGIYKQLMECLQVLVTQAADSLTYIRDVTDSHDYSLPQLSFASFKSLPDIWASSVSFIYWMREIELPSTNEFLETFEISSLNSFQLIPPFKKVGLILNGQQVVTMNGHHYSIDADCAYLLAADFKHQNFTITATVKRSRMASLIISSGGQTIELNPDAMPSLDKVRKDFPIYGKNIYAIRNPTSVEIYIDNSVYIYATLSLDICVIQISGFYYGRIFGLLGSTTSESYMDLTKPDMTVAQDLPTFIKSYQMSKKCRSPTPPVVTDHPQSEECALMFNGKSILKRGFSFVKIKPYRDMCEEMVARQSTPADKLDAACKAGLAFSLISYVRGYYITLPPKCSKCAMNGKNFSYEYSEDMNLLANSADVIVLLDKSMQNQVLFEELLLKSMSNIRSSSEKHNIRDLKFILLGYGGDDMYPSLHTTNGEVSLTENTNVKFSNSVPKEPSSHLGKVTRKVKYFLGFYAARQALHMANNYPFRPEAMNGIIQIDSNTHDLTDLDTYDIYNSFTSTVMSWNIIKNQIPVFLVTPKESISVNRESSSTNGPIFGFDMNSIFTINGPEPFKDGILGRINVLENYGASVMLPISSHGAIYNRSVFMNSDAAARSKLTNVFSNRVVESFVNVQRTVECVCSNKWGIRSELRCSLISSQPKL